MTKIITYFSFILFMGLMLGACGPKNQQQTDNNTTTMENKQLIIAASVNVKPEKVADFIEGTKGLIEQSRAEDGNISYTLYQSPTDSTQFIFFEEWKNQAAIDFHFNTPHFKGFGPFSEECVSRPTQLTIYEVNVKK